MRMLGRKKSRVRKGASCERRGSNVNPLPDDMGTTKRLNCDDVHVWYTYHFMWENYKKKKTKINIIIKKSPPFDSRPTMILHNGGLARARSGHSDGGGSLERGLWQ